MEAINDYFINGFKNENESQDRRKKIFCLIYFEVKLRLKTVIRWSVYLFLSIIKINYICQQIATGTEMAPRHLA